MCVRSFLYPFFTVINLLPHQVLSDWSQVSGPEAKLSPSDHESELFTISYQFPSLLSDPQGQKPDVGFRTFTIVQELLWYYCSPDCASLTQQVWALVFIMIVPSYHLIVASCLSLNVGYHFLVGSSVLLQQLVAILVLTQEMSTCISFYSAILNWKSLYFFKHDLSIRTLHDAERFKVPLPEWDEFLMTFFG